MIKRIIYFLPFLIFVFPPYDSLWKIGFLAGSIVLGLSLEINYLSYKRLILTAVTICLTLISTKKILETGGFKEAAQIYHHFGTNYDLPKNVLKDIQHQFLIEMPESTWCPRDNPGCWLNMTPPSRPWSFHFSLGQESNYYRRIQSFDYKGFRSLKRQFQFSRYSLDGDSSYRSWPSKHNPGYIKREDIPYILRLKADGELSKKLCWDGLVFHNQKVMPKKGCISSILKDDEIIAYSGVQNKLRINSPKANLENLSLLIQIFAFAIYLLIFKSKYKFSLVPTSVKIYLSMFFVLGGLKINKLDSPVFVGGDDGLTHSGLGTFILEKITRGQFDEALKGFESIYYFMPGLRYVWPVNLVLFGVTGYMFLGFALTIPFSVYNITKEDYSDFARKIIFVMTALFVWSFRTYIVKGFPEAISYSLYLWGLYFIAKNLFSHSDRRESFLGVFLITLSCFIRPNLVLSGFMVCSVFLLFQRKRLDILGLSLLGSIPVFLSLIHNIAFGSEFVLFTSSALLYMNLFCTPADYMAFNPTALKQVSEIFHSPLLFIVYGLPFYKVLSRKTKVKDILFLCTFLGLFATHFFWHPAGRYAWLTILSAVLFSLDIYANLIKRIFYHSSVNETYHPFKDDLALTEKLKLKITWLIGIDFFKFFYRPFIMPWQEIQNLIPKGAKVCDVGCGSGFFLYLLKLNNISSNVFGLEISDSLVNSSQELMSKLNIITSVAKYDGLNFPSSIKDYDVVILNDVYHHIPKDQRLKFMKNLSDSMPKGSHLIFKDMDAGKAFWIIFNKIHDLIISKELVSEISLDEAQNIVQTNQFQILEVIEVRKLVYSHYIIKAIKLDNNLSE